MFKNAKKEDYQHIAVELGLDISNSKTIFDLNNLIMESDKYKSNPKLVEDIANNMIEARRNDETKLLELEKLKIERVKIDLELAKIRAETRGENLGDQEKREYIESLDSLIKSVRTLTIKVPSRPESWSYFFSSLERAFISKNVPERYKAEILLNLLGEKATNVITYIKDDELGDYSKVKDIVIREFQPNPQSCLEQFRKTQRQPNETYVQLASRLTTSWDYYLKLKNVKDFETLNQLLISDKICQTLDKEVMCFINVRQAESWFKPIELAKEIDLYYSSKGKPVVDNSRNYSRNTYSKNVSKVLLTDVKNSKCILSCNENHPLFKCPVFNNMSVNDRVELVKLNNLCYLCFMKHRVVDCKSKFSCLICRKKHHVMLHFPREQKTKNEIPEQRTPGMGQFVDAAVFQPNARQDPMGRIQPTPSYTVSQSVDSQENLLSATCNLANEVKSVLLSTFVCLIKDELGNLYEARGILDVGANSNFICKRFADKLNLKREKTNISVSGINNLSLDIKSRVSAAISNRDKSFDLKLDFLVVPKITEFTPSRPLDARVSSLTNIKLADERFNVPGPIDLLLGAENFYEFLRPGQIYPQNTNLVLQDSVFGYIVSGSIPSKSENNIHCGLVTDNCELERVIKEFWEIENIERESEISKTKESEICEEHFLRNYSRSETGRYMVKMPLKEDPSCLGESKKKATKCLNSLWNRLIREPKLCELYKTFLQEYLSMGHMEEVTDSEEPGRKYYIPHHCVYRPESNSTPLRVVFNASALTSTGKSLNELQFNGGTIQDDLLSIMLRFRKHKFVLAADIKKMYRMILMHPEQRDLLRILFKPEVHAPVKVFRLCTVTYGTTSAPFLATRSVQQLAKDEGKEFPSAASVLLQDVYMDDILTGADDLNQAREIQLQLISLLDRGGMELHKWSANNHSLLYHESESEYLFTNETKTLGILWKPQIDCFGFNLKIEYFEKYSKRDVLSQIARVFDPLGLIGPIITRAKVFLQKLWLLKIDWCDFLPLKENAEWNDFLTSLKVVNRFSVPRCILIEQYVSVELHGFSDASELAYGAAIYVKSTNSHGDSAVKLLTSKSRVAPLKCISIPRLELSAAVLLAKLMKRVIRALRLEISKTYFWTDSTIVLAWLKKESKELKTFVSNRVSVIQDLTCVEQWHHVPSKQNPADFISRGMDPIKIHHCELWWNGPSFLLKTEIGESPDSVPVEPNDLFLSELKQSSVKETCALVNTREPFAIINNCSSFTKMQRVVAWCRRFIHNARNPLHPSTGTLTSSELSESLLCIVKNIQRTSFEKEIQCLERNLPIPNNSKLLNLCPFVDKNGILRVGGRLKNSNLSDSAKHPMIIPSNHNFTISVINHFHFLYFHAGAETTLSLIRSKFWIVSARNVIRKIIFNCIICKRLNAKASQQQMANLPAARVTVSRVFSKTGLDFCGPFEVKNFVSRSKQVKKVFVCVFVCFSTKALHFEIVNDLTSAAFLAALKRFVARRGKPSDIFSDNGRNFVGANRELRAILKSLFKGNSVEDIENYVANEGINWHFNPPSTPHFGGLWEASVKSLKYHLKRVVGKTILSYEEFLTLIIQVESVLNSRPLCPISNDPNDVEALTPAHFLIGSSLVAIPEPNYSEIPVNHLSRWQLVQRLTQHLWKKWSSEYLNKLLHRPKWHKGRLEVKEGDLVLVKEADNYCPLKWHLARILKIHPGQDNIVRIVTLKDKNGTYKRPMSKIVVLPYINEKVAST